MRRHGFTFIELIVVMGIIALASTMFFSAYKTFSRKQTLKKKHNFLSARWIMQESRPVQNKRCAPLTLEHIR